MKNEMKKKTSERYRGNASENEYIPELPIQIISCHISFTRSFANSSSKTFRTPSGIFKEASLSLNFWISLFFPIALLALLMSTSQDSLLWSWALLSSFFKKRRVFWRRSSTTRDSRTSPVDTTAAKSASLSGSSKTLAATWLIEKFGDLVSEKEVKLRDILENRYDFGHECADVLVVFAVR